MRRATIAFAILATTACSPGHVDVVGIDDFGNLRSAEWLQIELDGEDIELLALSTAPRMCEELTAAVEAFNDVYGGWLEEIEETQDWERFCEDAPEVYAQAADISDSFMGEDQRLIYLGLYDDDGDPEDIDDGDYESDGDGEDGGFFGYVNYYDENPYRVLADDWVDDYPRFCGVDADDLYEEAMQWWTLNDGDMQIERRGDDRVDVVLDAELHDEEGDNDGDIEAEFTATKCVIDVDDDDYHLSFF